jgi:hypothetical protein
MSGTAETLPAGDPAAPIAPPAGQGRGRSVLLPMVLILIGLGVLVVLFRASK